MQGEDIATDKEFSVGQLIRAVQYGDFPVVETAIENYGVSPNLGDKDGCTLLHWAAINNRLEIAKFLVSRHADVNTVGGLNGEIPLQWAVRHLKGLAMVHLLLSEGSNFNHKSVHGYSALFLAVQLGFVDTVFILLNHGCDPNTTDPRGDTPLYWTLRLPDDKISRTIEIQRLLIVFGASVAHKNNDEDTAMHILADSAAEFDAYLALMVYGDGSTMKEVNLEGNTPYRKSLRARQFSMTDFSYDAYFYRNLPKWQPIATTALTFASYLVIMYVRAFNIWGFVSAAALVMIESKLAQQAIICGSSRRSCGFAWGIILSVVSSYYVHFACSSAQVVYPRQPDLSSLSVSRTLPLSEVMSWQCTVTATALAVAIVGTLLATMNTAPQSLPANGLADTLARNNVVERLISAKSAEEVAAAATSHDSKFRLCTTCLVDKSAASMHCGSCNICVVNLDHHCPFVNNCVGRGNRRVFVLFTLFASMGCAYFAIISSWMQFNVLCDVSKRGSTEIWWKIIDVHICMAIGNPSLLAATYLSAATAIWIAGIFCGQVFMVFSETTTFEAMKRKNYGRFYWGRGMRNIFWFFWTGKYSIAAPPPCCDNHSHGHAVNEIATVGSGDSKGSSSGNSSDNSSISVIAAISINSNTTGGSNGNSREDKDHAV